jgi:hypothetical protein
MVLNYFFGDKQRAKIATFSIHFYQFEKKLLSPNNVIAILPGQS